MQKALFMGLWLFLVNYSSTAVAESFVNPNPSETVGASTSVETATMLPGDVTFSGADPMIGENAGLPLLPAARADLDTRCRPRVGNTAEVYLDGCYQRWQQTGNCPAKARSSFYLYCTGNCQSPGKWGNSGLVECKSWGSQCVVDEIALERVHHDPSYCRLKQK